MSWPLFYFKSSAIFADWSSTSLVTLIGFAAFMGYMFVAWSFWGTGSLGKSDISALWEDDLSSCTGFSSVISTSSELEFWRGVADSDTYSSLLLKLSSMMTSPVGFLIFCCPTYSFTILTRSTNAFVFAYTISAIMSSLSCSPSFISSSLSSFYSSAAISLIRLVTSSSNA